MTRRRWCSVVAALVSLSACSTAAAGSGGSTGGAASQPVELGPLPTQPAPATDVTTASIRPATTTPSAPPRTTAPPAAIAPSTTSALPTAPSRPTHTSCARLAYIGDSVSLGMVSPETLPDASSRLDFRLAEIGVGDLRAEVSGGRSIVETLVNQENAVDVAVRLRDGGFVGCWVIAIGTNDAANIAAGGARQADQRIASLMAVIGTDPVLWIDAATITDSGYWASPNIDAWNAVLTAVAPSYPNVRIAHWSTVVADGWFTTDGIHLTAGGAAARVQFVADALLTNFPLRAP